MNVCWKERTQLWFLKWLALTPAFAGAGSLPEEEGVNAKAERSDGPCGLQIPSGRAEKRRAWGGRSEACASCSDSLRLSERSERSERSEFRSAAPRPSIAGCPQRSEGTRPVGSAFFGYFLCRDKESDCAAGRTSRPTAHPPPPPHPANTVRPPKYRGPKYRPLTASLRTVPPVEGACTNCPPPT